MTRILQDTLLTAYMNGLVKRDRGAFCLIGTIIYSVLGYRVRDWEPMVTNAGLGLPIDEGYRQLAAQLTEALEPYGITLRTLYELNLLYDQCQTVDELMDVVVSDLERLEQIGSNSVSIVA